MERLLENIMGDSLLGLPRPLENAFWCGRLEPMVSEGANRVNDAPPAIADVSAMICHG